MKIGYATADWSLSYRDETDKPTFGGAGWYRIGLPSDALRRHTDHDVVVGMLVGNDEVLGVMEWPEDGNEDPAQHFDCDVVVIQRYMNDDLPEGVARAVANGQVVINDVDDWFWGLSTQNQAFLASHPKYQPEHNLNHYRKTLAASTMITTSTPYLASRLEEMFDAVPVTVVRNAIDLERYSGIKERSGESATLGWVGAQSWRSGDLETMQGILGPWLTRQKWSFHHSGDVLNAEFSAATLAGIPDDVIFTTSPMAPITDYPTLFGPIDVGIVPLNYCPFNEAKSAIKGMEYAASGVPFVAAATDEYRWLAEKVNVGRYARRGRDWLRMLDILVDPEVRKLEAAKNLQAVQRLSIDKQYINWLDAYRDAMSLAK